MVPPWRSAIFRQIARPIPVPSYSFRPSRPLEDLEDPVEYTSSKPMPLSLTVSSTWAPLRAGATLRPGRMHHRRNTGFMEFEGVSDRVLEQLADLGRIRLDLRQRRPISTASDTAAAPLSDRSTSRAMFVEVDPRERLTPRVVTPREAEQVVDERPHPGGRRGIRSK